MDTLWRNARTRVFRLKGRLQSTSLRAIEPDNLDYRSYSIFRPNQKNRGTLYGSPSSLEKYNTFHGAAHYEVMSFVDESGETHILHDVIVIKKFQPYVKINRSYTIYCISDISGRESKLMFALRHGRVEKEDLDGVGSIIDNALSSMKRQLSLVAIPSILSILLFSLIVLKMVASVLGPAVYVLFALIIGILAVFLAVGLLVVKNKLQAFPSRDVLAEILETEGFTLVDQSSLEMLKT
jgi:hypothetical protein